MPHKRFLLERFLSRVCAVACAAISGAIFPAASHADPRKTPRATPPVCQKEHAPARVRIDRVKPAGKVFGNKVKVEGTIEGVCIAEAGLYEGGERKKELKVVAAGEFRRFEFEVKTRLQRGPEIRVTTIDGTTVQEPIILEQR